MAAPTGTQQTYQTIGIREDLTDVIHDISPTDTPFMTMAKRVNVSQTKHEWQTDALASASGTNAVIEGDDATTNTASATVRLSNYTQLSDKVVRVSSTNQAVVAAGRNNELAYQTAKRAKELKRDMETRLTGNYASTSGTATTARACGGVESWITTNDNRGSGAGATQGSDGGYSNGTTSAATDASSSNLRTFTEARLKTVLADCWSQGGDPGVVMVGPYNKQKASEFDGIATLYRDTAGSRAPASILGAADVYVSDFGEVQIVPNRFSRDRTALVLDMDYWGIGYLSPFKREKLAKTGHSDRYMLSVEFTLESSNEAASGVVSDLLTS